jgi:sugar (pentulose or hexulose) kinase
MSEPWLGIDIGATSGRGVLGRLERERLVLEEIHRFPHGPVLLGGTLWWDVLHLWSGVLESFRACARHGAGRLAGVGVTTWGIDFGLLSAEGRLLENPVCYRDARTVGMDAVIRERFDDRRFYGITGMTLSRIGTLPQLLSLRRQPGNVLDRTQIMLQMPDLFRFFLGGDRRTEPTIAGSTLMTDVRRSSWSREVLEAFGLPGALLPSIGRCAEVDGRLSEDVRAETAAGAVPVIAVAGHDTLSAVAAAPLAGPRTVFLSTGTWSVLGLAVAEPVTTDAAIENGFVNELAVEGIALVKNLMGFYLLEDLRVRWGNPPYADLVSAAESARPFRAVLDLEDPAFFAPENAEAAVTAYLERTGQAAAVGPSGLTRGEMVRGQLEGLALLYRRTLDELRAATGVDPDGICLVGGGCRNRVFCQLVADATGLPVAAGPVEATAVGNLGLQMVATGALGSPADVRALAARSFPQDRYEPHPGVAWDEAYARYRRIVSSRRP